MKPSVFEYEDYRRYLKDAYDASKAAHRSFSFRFFAREAGFTSPNFLKLVMEGKRNLTGESIPKFAKALKLGRQESEFFEALVFFNQAKSPQERTKHYERMTRSRRYREIRALEKEQFEYYSKWYYSAVRELVNLRRFREDPAWIGKTLVPQISPAEAARALALLLKIGLLDRGRDGRLRQVDALITPGPRIQSLALINFHRGMIERASDSLETVLSEERDVSAITLGVPESRLPELKERVARFHQELLASIGASTDPCDRVYQLNIQLFPLSRAKEGEK